jgi:predicted component of type VI protein secretion system
MKATTLLAHQREALAELLDQLAGDEAERIPLLLRLVDDLLGHIAIEAHFFFWSIRDTVTIDLGKFYARHALMKRALTALVHAEAEDREFFANLERVRVLLAIHSEEMERELLPLVLSAMADHELEAVGARMERFYASSLPPRRASVPPAA